jgi:tetracycline 7-halogenase / FADH2 O2-dependent halogenase
VPHGTRFNPDVQSAFDIAVVGSGFAGSLIAMIARQLGRSVVLLEKSKHPRFVIGESSTPLANLLLEELSDRYGLNSVRPFAKFATWRAAHPEITVGLKRGFTFYYHEFGRGFVSDDAHSNELLVAASPNDTIADTHWYRPEFDGFLVTEAQRFGVEYLDEVDLWGANVEPKRAVIHGRHRGKMLEIHADLVIDASGPRGFLHRALDLPEVPFKQLPATQAIYSHFTGVKRWDELHHTSGAPYQPDDAAVHHVFHGGWIWVLRFNNGVTSAGAALETKLANELRASGAEAWTRLLEKLPSVHAQFANAKPTMPFIHTKQLSFLSGYVAGRNWVLLPAAAGFVDPLLSTGFPLTLLGVERLANILETKWQRDDFADELFNYSMQTTVELVTTGRLIAALYATMRDFELFRALTLLYFAAASFTESARRLGKPQLAGGTFLLGEHPEFGPRFRYCIDRALSAPTGEQRDELLRRIHQTIAPVNVAELANSGRRHWYPALAEDLFANSAKLEATRGEIASMLRRCGFTS